MNYPEKLETMIFSMGWFSLSDPSLLTWLGKRFPNVKKIYFKGVQSDGVLYGFDNKALKLMSRLFCHLTHLFIDGYGIIYV
jgi:hypothetical protein